MWHTDLLLGSDRERYYRATAVARQQILNKQHLNDNNRGIVGNGVFYSVCAKGLCNVDTSRASLLKVRLQREN
jgi:hypothetical protein